MRDYSVHYKNGEVKEIEVTGRKDLLDTLFQGSEDRLKAEVSMLKWKTANMFFTENVAAGKIDSEITTADANPYGWRNEGSLQNKK